MRAADAWKKWAAPDAPDAPPSLAWPYQPAKRALLVRAQYAEIPPGGKSAWTDSAGVRGVMVLGLDARPAEAKRALVEFREGKALRQVWVEVDLLASTPAAAAQKLAHHFSALLAAQRLAQKPVTTTAGSAEASASSSVETGAETPASAPAPETTRQDPDEKPAAAGWMAKHEAQQEAAA